MVGGRLRGAHADLHRRREGDRRPDHRAEGAHRRACRGGRGRGRRGRGVRARRSWGCPTASSRTGRGSVGRSWPPCGGSVPTWCCAPTRPPSSSGRTTSTTGTTASPGSPCSTRCRRRPPCPTTSPRRGRPTRCRPSCCPGRSNPTSGSTSATRSTVKGAAVGCHRSQFPDGGEWAVTAMRLAAEDAGRHAGVAVRRGLPETAPRRVSGPAVPDDGDAARPEPGPPACGAGDPPRGHGRLLRVGGGPGRPVAGGPAGDRRRERAAGRGGRLHLRGAHVRRALGDAVFGGPAEVSRRRLPRRPVPPLHRGESSPPRDPRVVHAPRRGHLAGRGIPRRLRRGPSVRRRDPHRRGHPGPGPPRDVAPVLGRRGTVQADGEAGVEGGQAPGLPDGDRAGPRGRRGPRRRRAGLPAPAARSGPCGGSGR